MINHSHKFTIADHDAVETLVGKLVNGGKQKPNLLRALDDATRHYGDSSQKVRQAFFHGLLTGYAVALKLAEEDGFVQHQPRKRSARV